MDCIRCGGCCLHTPCWFSQIEYHITEANMKQCPDLVKDGDKYKCLMVERDSYVKHELIGTGCHYPELRIDSEGK